MKQDDILGSVRVASPCKASWDKMEGDERVRHCEACRHNVYNLSGMTRAEAETLVAGAEGRLCVRFYRRPDGTMLTTDCPVGVSAVRKRMATTLACAAAMFISLYSYASNLGRRQPIDSTDQAPAITAYEKARRVEVLRVVLDRINPPPPPRQFLMGAVASPRPRTVAPIPSTPTPRKDDL